MQQVWTCDLNKGPNPCTFITLTDEVSIFRCVDEILQHFLADSIKGLFQGALLQKRKSSMNSLLDK